MDAKSEKNEGTDARSEENEGSDAKREGGSDEENGKEGASMKEQMKTTKLRTQRVIKRRIFIQLITYLSPSMLTINTGYYVLLIS
ncbi:hypothetical protein EMCRGX_G000789 [Ephydatia muelleri]